MRWRRATRVIVLGILHALVVLPKQVCSTGSFELKLKEFRNEHGLNSDGNCCNGYLKSSVCSSTCRTFFSICLTHYQAQISDNPQCTFASMTSPVLGENNVEFDNVSLLMDNPVRFPFQISWPGTFSIVIEAWHDTTLQGPQSGSPRELISRLAAQRSAQAGTDWLYYIHATEYTQLEYSYRIVCDENYYGPSCSIFCRPRDDQFGHYTCSENGTKICMGGWTGQYCDQAICLPGCHTNHGFCDTPNECKCRLGWQGQYCNQCLPYPGCQHGSCTEPWQCNCAEGWGGLFCNQDLNYCTHHSPCKNGGTCQNSGQGSYTCVCDEGFTGTNCEVEIDDCQNDPCLNGGTCKDIGFGYQCHCPLGFTGRRCDIVAESCANNPCKNGATCVEGQGPYTCICKPGYTGLSCETEINECDPNPCLHGGRCVDELNGFRCVCSAGYSGRKCEENVNDCSHNPCQNGGSCMDRVNDFECRCVAGFVGSLCEINVDDCELRPCANGGTCKDLVNDFTCICKPGFSGKDCRLNVNDCNPNPCTNDGSCVDLVSDYRCTCKQGFSGKNCQFRTSDNTQMTVTKLPERTTTERIVDKPTTYHPNSNISSYQQQQSTPVSGELTTSHLLLIVCLGAGIPLLIIIVVVTIFLCRRRRSLEETENLRNAKNNKETNIFITPNSSKLKVTNETQDINTKTSKSPSIRPTSKVYSEKPNNKHSNIKDFHERISSREYENRTKRLDKEHLSIDPANLDVRDCETGIHFTGKPSNINRNSKLILEEQTHRNSHYFGADVLATEV
ncbi:hypothetical protein ACJMK2_035925 [Sinanodonta woodiana]|uniref:Delta-like protein n=1 Tax=Sinanodonta woodiana TaxID=1069815 RepID=A0ABD3WFL1_SINWO